ncbi:DUF58 domain-containing protein [Roseobacter litoralis]|uniref:DUF58 domain-containing protein n=1 Tax=Roseobacter litoralis (strain ATCC 49566 / DSM 6996 / JCM 21268 / NBRC 15278 / OCh 149) TaxID=391595 RepID=F7ZFH1_ROSLO|nr:DUF58 domain-containing protein [Roseobacter litoralis]AEI95976.1 hypothetical protein DUF58 [Roseobacter litoralis Och 149]
MRDIPARIRTNTLPDPAPVPAGLDTRIHVTLPHLRGLEGPARGLHFMPRQPARSVLNGRHTSRLRGRGLNFEELRDYMPADDVRSIDWKVTARTGKPYVRVFTEERDRPTLIVVDQRMSMFFGSVLNMKSVTAAECAALAAFAILEQGDRVGGIVFGDDLRAEIKPARSRAALNRFLSALASANQLLRPEAPTVPPQSINQVLGAVARIAPRNHLVIVLSDFDVIDDQTRKLVSGLSRHNDLILGLVTDPFADDLPPDAKLVITDGVLQAAVDMSDSQVHRDLSEFAKRRIAEIVDWQRQFGISVLPLTSAEDSLVQMRRLMGLGRR